MGEIALSVVVLEQTGSAAAVAAIFLAGQFLPALAGQRAVALVERLAGPSALRLCLAAEAAIALLLAAACTTAPLLVLLALVALDGVFALAARSLLRASMVAVTRPAGLLREGNSVLVGLFSASSAAGPLAAGMTVALLGPAVALGADAATFALAALAVGAYARTAPEGEQPADPRAARRFARERPALRQLLGTAAVMSMLGSAVLPLEIVLVVQTLGGSETQLGLVLGLWGAGAVVGSALLPLLRHANLRGLTSAAVALCGLSYVGMGGAPSIEVLCLFSLLGGVSNGIEAFALTTAIQESTPDRLQTQMAALTDSLILASAGAGFLLGGAVATLTSPRAVYVLAGAGILAVAMTLARPRRQAARSAAVAQPAAA